MALVDLIVSSLVAQGVNAHGNYNYDDEKPRQRFPFVAVERAQSAPFGQTYGRMAGADLERALVGVYGENEAQVEMIAKSTRLLLASLLLTDETGVTTLWDAAALCYVAVYEVSKFINR